jgi:uncharacterized protein (TIGR03000 family)
LLWFEGRATTRTGAERDFVSPELTPGTSYTWEVKARWVQDGRDVEQTRQVVVRPNETVTVEFGAAPAANVQAVHVIREQQDR